MKAFVVNKYTDNPNDIQEKEVKEPEVSGNNILVKNLYIATNPVDVKLLNSGKVGEDIGNDFIVGFDACGVVDRVGADCQLFKEGDEVYYAGCVGKAGTFAEKTLVDERIVGKKPSSLSKAEAASVPLTVITAYESLFEQFQLKEGEDYSQKSILIIPGAGGVGAFVSQLAKNILKFRQVIGTASREESNEFAKSRGCDIVINHRNNLIEELKKYNITGVDYIFVALDVSKYYWKEITELINPLGKICSIHETAAPVDIKPLMVKRATFTWELMFTRPLFNVQPEKQHELLNLIGKWIDEKRIVHNLKADVFKGFEGLKEALTVQKSGKAIGKLVVEL